MELSRNDPFALLVEQHVAFRDAIERLGNSVAEHDTIKALSYLRRLITHHAKLEEELVHPLYVARLGAKGERYAEVADDVSLNTHRLCSLQYC